MPSEKSARFGNATGAHCCMEKGATEGIKTFDEIQNYIKISHHVNY